MPNYNLPTNLTNGSTGIEQIFIYESTQIDIFAPALLLLIFSVIVGAGYYAQDRRVGKGNLPMWFATSGVITTFLGIILFLYEGIINLNTLIICIVSTIIFTLWFLYDNTSNYS